MSEAIKQESTPDTILVSNTSSYVTIPVPVAGTALETDDVVDSSSNKLETLINEPAAKKQRTTATRKNMKSPMGEDIEEMMFGFGDNWPPKEESVTLIECVVKKYIEDLTLRAKHISELTGKLDKECFMYVVRKDRAKFTRVCQLLRASEELQNAQKEVVKEDE
jgi:hypothetical protein